MFSISSASSSIVSFGPRDWPKLFYIHDGSNTYSDNVALRLKFVTHNGLKTKGQKSTDELRADRRVYEETILLLVDVLPVDDDPPRIEVNEGMRASPSSYIPVTPSKLKIVDDESPDVTIEIVGTEHNEETTKAKGLIFKAEEKHDASESDEDDDDDVNYVSVTSFTQSDVNAGRIFYKAPATNKMFLDRVWLRAGDGADNFSQRFALTVAVSPVDTLAPTLFPGATLQLTVDEYRVTEFGRDNMRSVTFHSSRQKKHFLKCLNSPGMSTT